MNYLVLSSLVKQTIRELDLVSKIIRYDTTWESLETVEGYEKPPKEEFEAKLQELIDAQPLKELRHRRNKRLAECDWVAIRAFTTGTPVPEEWKTYMQALRDLPANTEDPENPVWPVPPE
tara:strand:- start:59 stop:418 length:360 start_codon:yes stop_codon:yes gene_type:complete